MRSFEETLQKLERKAEQLNSSIDVVQSGKEAREMKQVDCQTGEEYRAWQDQLKKLPTEKSEKEREKRAQRKRNLKVL